MRFEKCKPSCNAENFAGAAYQDARYGPGIRVKNPTGAVGGKVIAYRCTVCGNSPGISGGPAAQKRTARIQALKSMSFAVMLGKIQMMKRGPFKGGRK